MIKAHNYEFFILHCVDESHPVHKTKKMTLHYFPLHRHRDCERNACARTAQ